jgi:phospholipase C
VPPWGDKAPGFPTHFAFDRYGARVPAILVSPWVQKGTVFRSATGVPFDHTSVLSTTLKWLGQDGRLPDFGERAAKAPAFDAALTLDEPRTDASALGFLDVARRSGDPVRFGDHLVLKSEGGKYLSIFSRTMKVGTELPSDDLMGFAVDLDLAAYFPTLGGASRAPLTLLTAQPDPPAEVADGSKVFIVTLEPGVGANNFLGAWSDSHDCYYFNNYIQGGYLDNETWLVKQVQRRGQPLRYGDKVYLENVHFKGQRLTQDTRLAQGAWISTAPKGGYWTIEPAVTR